MAIKVLREDLSASLGAGRFHRDIKPENVMLSGRHALVTDLHAVAARSCYFGEADVGCDPMFWPLHASPRFAATIAKAGQQMCSGDFKWPMPGRSQ